MGKRFILSEDEKLNIRDLYKGLINEQSERLPSITDQTVLCDIIDGRAAVRRGDRGDLVKIFQEALIECGYDVGSTGADGIFGGDTARAVGEFQRDNSLQIDRAIGPETSGALCQKGCLDQKCKECKQYKENPKVDNEKLRGDENTIGTQPIKDGSINIDCQRVQGCISEFMLEFQEDSCLDEDMLRKLLKCVGVGSCFDGGEIPQKTGFIPINGGDKTTDV
jgi:hypothetical protein